jgi:hypothetical protein
MAGRRQQVKTLRKKAEIVYGDADGIEMVIAIAMVMEIVIVMVMEVVMVMVMLMAMVIMEMV